MFGVVCFFNYYFIGDEKVEEGMVNLVFGLGKYIVDGGMILCFLFVYFLKVLQISELDIVLKEMQICFYVFDLKNVGDNFLIDDGFNFLKLYVKEVEKDGLLCYIVFIYDFYDQVIWDGLYFGGCKVIMFVNILQYDVFLLVCILCWVFCYGQQEMCCLVEIEFVVMFNYDCDKIGIFYLFQVCFIVDSKDMLDEDFMIIFDEDVLFCFNNFLGYGIMNEIYDIVYVKIDYYSVLNNQNIVWEIEKINQ